MVLNKQILVPSQLNWSTIIGPRLEAVWVGQLELQTASLMELGSFFNFFFFSLSLIFSLFNTLNREKRAESCEGLKPTGLFFFSLTCRHPFALWERNACWVKSRLDWQIGCGLILNMDWPRRSLEGNRVSISR